MKPNDEKILYHIRRNARTNLTTISRKTGIPVSTIFDRLRSHEGRLITKFTALLNFAELGYPVHVTVLIKVSPGQRTQMKHYLLAHPSVNDLYRINNGYDFQVTCVFRSVKESEDFMDELELKFHISARQVFHEIDVLAREKMFADDVVLEAR